MRHSGLEVVITWVILMLPVWFVTTITGGLQWPLPETWDQLKRNIKELFKK